MGKKIGGSRKEVLRIEKLCNREKELEYQERVQEIYDMVKERELGDVGCASDVCGKRVLGVV